MLRLSVMVACYDKCDATKVRVSIDCCSRQTGEFARICRPANPEVTLYGSTRIYIRIFASAKK